MFFNHSRIHKTLKTWIVVPEAVFYVKLCCSALCAALKWRPKNQPQRDDSAESTSYGELRKIPSKASQNFTPTLGLFLILRLISVHQNCGQEARESSGCN